MSETDISRILAIDDEVTSLLMLTGILRGAGFRVDCAGTLQEGLAAADTGHYDLILLDMHLPDGEGIDLCVRLKNRPLTSQTPVIFISVDADIKTKLAGFEAGGADYVTKPWVSAEILARVRTHLRMNAAYKAMAMMQAERIKRLAIAQNTIMPRPEDIPKARFEVANIPYHEAGGDFYDVIPVGDEMVDYVVADASGHDLDASFWTAAIKALLREYATGLNSPLDIMQSLNSSLVRLLPQGTFFTVIYARLNRRNNVVQIANAGHPPAILVSSEEPVRAIHQEGDVAGAFQETVFDMVSLPLRLGSRLFLYSDGLVEMSGTREAGIPLLMEACDSFRREPLKGMVESVVGRIRAQGPAGDDIVLMGIEI